MNEVCRQCIIDKFRDRIPDGTMEETAQDYRESVVRIAHEEETGPEAAYLIRQLRKVLLGEEAFDYSEIKKHYNALVLSEEKEITEKIAAADDRILRATQYAMTGNFVDFGALDSVTESDGEGRRDQNQRERLPGIPEGVFEGADAYLHNG